MSAIHRGLSLAILVLFTFVSTDCMAQTGSDDGAKAAAVPGDRWMEIDLYWFDRDHLPVSVDAFWDRFGPMYQDIRGDRGLILNVGWTVSYIMEWNGDLSQRITLPRGTGQQPWVAETSSLPGDTQQRIAEWKERFSKPIMIPKLGYGAWTYGDLKALCELLREGADKRGIHRFKVGSLVYAWDNAYGERAPWADRHPEAFNVDVLGDKEVYSGARRFFNPGQKLHADTAKMGGFPNGYTEGMPAHVAFAAQWGSLSKAVQLNALMLRDSFGFPVPYTRGGPLGALMPSASLIRQATDDVSALVRETKQANPSSLLMMYSNAASAVADWRSNGCDLERIAKEGYLDIFVDQTWAGAWNEIGVRHNAFWNEPTLGWTYQLDYTLVHGAMLAGTKVRHYPLIETFDAWESWDVLHTVPQRLRWGIWAYSHAAVKTPEGIVMPQGSYISWANQGKRLLSEQDVDFLNTNISAAVTDAAGVREVYGPTLTYSREAMQWQIDHARADNDIKEWIDEQAGSIAKWPVPILSITRTEWLPRISTDLAIVQTPSHLNPETLAGLKTYILVGHPVALFGSFAGGIDPSLLQMAGIGDVQRQESKASLHTAKVSNASEYHVESDFPTLTILNRSRVSGKIQPIYSIEGSPQFLQSDRDSVHLLLWDPADLAHLRDTPLRETWGGSAAPYVITAEAITRMLAAAGKLHADSIVPAQTMVAGAWRTADGKVHLLFGNLEEGLRDDADRSRHDTMVLPAAWDSFKWRSVWKETSTISLEANKIKIDLAPDASLLVESNGDRR
jgi:hypothetical protein